MKRLLLVLLLCCSSPAWATIASVGALVSTHDTGKTSTTSLVATPLNQLDAGNIGVCAVAIDNTATSDGNSNDVTSMSDSVGNTWTKIREFTNAQTGAAAGATVALFMTKATTNLTTGGTITANFSAAVADGMVCQEFSIGAGNVFTSEGTWQDLAADNAAPGSMTIGSLTSQAHIYLRATAHEGVQADAYTPTTNWTQFTTNTDNFTTGGATASNMGPRCEFRIVTNTTDTSNPTYTNADHASVMVVFYEAAAPAGGKVLVIQ